MDNGLYDFKYGGPVDSYSAQNYYEIKLTKDIVTVEQFTNKWVEDKREWGTFVICHNNDIVCEYSFKHGSLINKLSNEILESEISKVAGYGGWSYSRIRLYI